MLSDRIAIVTGGASGIGRAIVHRFAREGAHVIAIDRDAAQLSETATASALIEAAAADVTDHGAIERIVGVETGGCPHTAIRNPGHRLT